MARPAGPGAPKDAATGQLGLALGPTSGPNRTMPFMEVVLKVSRVALHKLMKWLGKSPGLLGRHKIWETGERPKNYLSSLQYRRAGIS